MKHRKILIEIPSDFCNSCIFFRTWDPDPESCTGFGGFREYYCKLFQKDLKTTHKVVRQKRSMWETEVRQALICDECYEKYGEK